MRKTLLCAAVLITFAVPALAQQRGFRPADYYRMTFVSDVALAPVGDLLAFTVTTINEKDNKRHREIWLQKLAAGQADGQPFRFTDPTQESSGPRWSPDGSLLAFSSQRAKDRNSTWFMRVRGPGGEAYHVPGVEGAPVWSPDGRWVAYARAEQPDTASADDARERRRDGWVAPNAVTNTLDTKRFDGRVITSMRYKRDGTLALLPHYSVDKRAQLYVVPAEGGSARRLTNLPHDVRGPVWLSDGRTLLFAGDEQQDDEYNFEPTSDLFAIARDGGEPRKLTSNPGGETAPAVSPDGKRLAFLRTPARGAQTDVMVVEIAADGTFRGEPRNLTADWDLQPGMPSWTPDGRLLRFAAQIVGADHLFEVSATGGTVAQVTTGNRQLNGFSFSKDGRLMAYTASNAETPAEVFLARANGSGEVRVSSFNDGWLAEVVRMPAERLTWTVADGTQIEGWLVKPVGYQPGNRYPLVLKIHGGPHGAYGYTFFDMFHVLSGAGFFVLYPNPRGSTGYGHAFTYATRGKWGETDSEDYLKGVDAALARYPDIDPGRVGVSGGSYGGFMSNWLTATTKRFAASASSRSIVNWESWYGSSDAQGLTEYEFFGTPWEQRETYRRLSPITYVENVTAPTLLIESVEDWRTPIGEGEAWFMALMKRKVPVELVRYPRSSHGLSRTGEPWLLVDRLERIKSWLAYWLIEQPAKKTAEAGS